MPNELLLILSLLLTFSFVLAAFYFFKEQGLFLWTTIATIAANIEVLIIVNAFGMEMTLGNILFASTFLVTDILSELYGKKEAQKAVYLGIATSVIFICISQSWLLYTPNQNDFVMPSMNTIFSNTPRLMLVGILVYVIVQLFDVWLYHKWWDFTNRKWGDARRFLWLRNNGSTLVSQALNTILFNVGAFWGIYSAKTILSIALSSYVIFLVTSLADTPFVYLARYLKDKNIDFHTFMSNSLEKQDLFLDILEEAEEEIGFEVKDCPVRIEALAMANGEFIVTVTRVIPETKNIHKKISAKRKNIKTNAKYAIYKFASFEDFCNFITFLENHNLSLSYKVAQNILLYLYKEEYYIVFDSININYSDIQKFNSAIIEFAKFVNNSKVFISKLLENGQLIIANNAIKIGMKYF